MFNNNLQGKQIGTYMKDKKNGIRVTMEPYASIYYQRIVDGQLDEYAGLAMEKDVYDERQGTYVAGIVLCDASGNPIESEQYKLSDFTWSGNISYGGGSPINFGW